MPLIFHQNMRVFNGITLDRIGVFGKAMGAVHYRAKEAMMVAGFTELTKTDAAMANAILALAQKLDADIDKVTLIAAGRTIGSEEYIGIAWNDATMPVDLMGQVLLDSSHQWASQACAPAASIALPKDVSAFSVDSRGLAFIASRNADHGTVVAFMHNMYGVGDRSGAFQNLPTMEAAIAKLLKGKGYPDKILFYFGGDFNVDPHDPRRSGDLKCLAAASSSGSTINTTNHHAYDFFLSNDPRVTAEDASVWKQTRCPRGSDHAGISLDVPSPDEKA